MPDIQSHLLQLLNKAQYPAFVRRKDWDLLWRKRQLKRRYIKRLQLMIIIILGLALIAVSGCGQLKDSDPNMYSDPCRVFFSGSIKDYPDKLQKASVGVDFVSQFPATSFYCASTVEDGISRMRSVYIEFADEFGTVAIAAVLNEKEETSEWKDHINRTLYGLGLVYDEIVLEDGYFLLGWSSKHPRVEEAQNLHVKSGHSISLADIVSSLQNDMSERTEGATP